MKSKQVSAAEMQAIDRKAIEQFGIPSLLLMENAGRGIAELIVHQTRGKRVTILAGSGNNGGDGLVVARHLHNHGYNVFVLLFSDPSAFKSDPAINYGILQKMKISLHRMSDQDTDDFLRETILRSDVVVDALFGVGLARPLTGLSRTAVEVVNDVAKQVVAVDLPSGIHSDTGEVMGCAVKATLTATLGLLKAGLMRSEGPRYAGKIALVDISLPRELL